VLVNSILFYYSIQKISQYPIDPKTGICYSIVEAGVYRIRGYGALTRIYVTTINMNGLTLNLLGEKWFNIKPPR
jgi:hypothetical protein